MNEFEQAQNAIMAELINAPAHQLKPHELEKKLSARLGLSVFTVREAVKQLVEEGEATYSYHDPDSFVEISPIRPHHAARPMKVVLDAHGNPWICDANVDPTAPLPGQGCWDCGEVPFTRND